MPLITLSLHSVVLAAILEKRRCYPGRRFPDSGSLLDLLSNDQTDDPASDLAGGDSLRIRTIRSDFGYPTSR